MIVITTLSDLKLLTDEIPVTDQKIVDLTTKWIVFMKVYE